VDALPDAPLPDAPLPLALPDIEPDAAALPLADVVAPFWTFVSLYIALCVRSVMPPDALPLLAELLVSRCRHPVSVIVRSAIVRPP